MDDKAYHKEREILIDAEREAARSYDKTLITLSAGALVLSFTFIREMKTPPIAAWQIYCAWAAFVVSLFLVLASFLLSQSAMRRQRDIIDDQYTQHPSLATPKSNPYVRWIVSMNWASLVLLALGVILFAAFATSNLCRSEPPCKATETQSVPRTR